MRQRDGKLFFAPTDLSRFLACRHLTSLSRSVALGETSPPPEHEDPRLDALIRAGKQHEAEILERYRAEGRSVETISDSCGHAEGRERTLDAMRRGVDVIHQGRLGSGGWSGYADFLVRVTRPRAFGDWSCEVVALVPPDPVGERLPLLERTEVKGPSPAELVQIGPQGVVELGQRGVVPFSGANGLVVVLLEEGDVLLNLPGLSGDVRGTW